MSEYGIAVRVLATREIATVRRRCAFFHGLTLGLCFAYGMWAGQHGGLLGWRLAVLIAIAVGSAAAQYIYESRATKRIERKYA